MIEQITKGIKISIETEFEGTFYEDDCIHYAFSYEVVIENQSNDVAQLIARKWNIMEALNENETIIGEGVVGEKPILIPGDRPRIRGGWHFLPMVVIIILAPSPRLLFRQFPSLP